MAHSRFYSKVETNRLFTRLDDKNQCRNGIGCYLATETLGDEMTSGSLGLLVLSCYWKSNIEKYLSRQLSKLWAGRNNKVPLFRVGSGRTVHSSSTRPHGNKECDREASARLQGLAGLAGACSGAPQASLRRGGLQGCLSGLRTSPRVRVLQMGSIWWTSQTSKRIVPTEVTKTATKMRGHLRIQTPGTELTCLSSRVPVRGPDTAPGFQALLQ